MWESWGQVIKPSPKNLRFWQLGVLAATGSAYGLFYAGLRTTSGSAAAVLTLLEPLTAALLAVAVLREPLPLPAVAGGALLLGAVAALYVRPPAPARGPAGARPPA